MFNYPPNSGYISAVPYYPPRAMTPQMMPQPMEQPAPMAGQSLIKVNGRAGADAFQLLSPNSTAALFDANEDVFYIKSTDGAAYPTVKAYRFVPLADSSPAAPMDYVQRSEFDEFKIKLEEALKNVQQSVRRGKGAPAEPAD